MAENSIIKIDGKPLEKLIDVISKGIGKLYKPTEIRKTANAKAYQIETIARANANAQVINSEIEFELKAKVESRLNHRETKRQLNIENITFKSAEQLQHEINVSEESLNEDWITRFFDNIQDVSNEDMQILWSRILTGEIKHPNSFSLRTLDFLKNLSQNDAKLLTKVSKFAIKFGPEANALLYKSCHQSFTEKWDFYYDDFTTLIELGLLNSLETDFLIRETDIGSKIMVGYGQNAISFERNANGNYFGITATRFSKVGNELLKLIDPEFNEEYLDTFIKIVHQKRKDITVKKGICVNVIDGVKLYDNFKEIIFD